MTQKLSFGFVKAFSFCFKVPFSSWVLYFLSPVSSLAFMPRAPRSSLGNQMLWIDLQLALRGSKL